MEMLVIATTAILAFTAVLLPLVRRDPGGADDEQEFDTGAPADDRVADDALAATTASPAASATAAADDSASVSGDRIEREVLRYREALRAGTLCPRCGQANPPGSVYCADCGKRLPLADAREFA